MKMGTASERLSEARTLHKAAVAQIAELEARFDACLRIGARGAAAVADDELFETQRLVKRLQREIQLLGPEVETEEQQQQQDRDFPSTAAAARARLAELEARQRQLAAIPKFERSASVDAERDALICTIGAMRQRISWLEKMEKAA